METDDSGEELGLRELYSEMYQTLGTSRQEANQMAEGLLSIAKEEIQKAGLSTPPNFGDVLIQQEQKNEQAKRILELLRSEGATDTDIRWWWNMSDLSRGVLKAHNNNSKFSLWLFLKDKEELDNKQATQMVLKIMPLYGDPRDTTQFSGDDRLLPYELMERVNVYIEKNSHRPADLETAAPQGSDEIFDRLGDKIDRSVVNAIRKCSSFNAFVRAELLAGRLDNIDPAKD
jgi:hypothetical protein